MNNDKFDALDNLSSQKEQPKIIDGLIKIHRENLPHGGEFYPQSWEFAYSCPSAKDIANFSTLDEKDYVGILQTCEELIRKHVIIFDTETNQKVSSGQINDSDRYYFLLLLREYFLPSAPLTFETKIDAKDFVVELRAASLRYKQQSEKLLNVFDGRTFTFLFDELPAPISFLIPTIETTARFFKYLVRAHKDSQTEKDKSKYEKMIFEKQFILFAPYLYETGSESVKELAKKFEELREDEKRFKQFNEIISRLNLSNLNHIEFEINIDGEVSMEEAQIKFPEWKKLFITQTDNSGYFG